MSNHTAQDLLAAVGVDAKSHPELWSTPTPGTPEWHSEVGLPPNRRQKFAGSKWVYTGPALGTPELDAVLLVEGVKFCRCNWQLYQDVNDAIYKLNETEIDATDTFALEWLLFHCDQPGARLARAIWAAMKGGGQ